MTLCAAIKNTFGGPDCALNTTIVTSSVVMLGIGLANLYISQRPQQAPAPIEGETVEVNPEDAEATDTGIWKNIETVSAVLVSYFQ